MPQMRKGALHLNIKDLNPTEISYKIKTKGGLPLEGMEGMGEGLPYYDEGQEGVDFNYDKHGNKWAIVRPENHPARQQEYRPERLKENKPSLLDNYDPGIFKK